MYFRILWFYTMNCKIDWVMWYMTDWFNHMLAEILDIYNNAISSTKACTYVETSARKNCPFLRLVEDYNKKNLVYACSNDHSENYDITFLRKWMFKAIRIFYWNHCYLFWIPLYVNTWQHFTCLIPAKQGKIETPL